MKHDQLANDSCVIQCESVVGKTYGSKNLQMENSTTMRHSSSSNSSRGNASKIVNLLSADLHSVIEMWNKSELHA